MNFYITVLLLFNSSIAFSAEPDLSIEDLRKCHMKQVESFYEIHKLYNDQELIGGLIIDTYIRGGTVLDNGTKIESSCFTGNREKDKEIKERFNRAFQIVSKRSLQCSKKFGFKEVDKINDVYRQTVIMCGKMDNPSDGAKLFYGIPAKVPYGIPFTPFWWNREGIASAPLMASKYGYMVGFNKALLKDNALTDEHLAWLLAHEAMHGLNANQREWHNDAGKKNGLGCEESVFTDYIYFTGTVCFPNNQNGDALYSVINRCENVCLEAMLEVDEKVTDDFGSYMGDSLAFKPHSLKQAKKICNAVKNSDKKWYLSDE